MKGLPVETGYASLTAKRVYIVFLQHTTWHGDGVSHSPHDVRSLTSPNHAHNLLLAVLSTSTLQLVLT